MLILSWLSRIFARDELSPSNVEQLTRDVWRKKSDEEVFAAAADLDGYTEIARKLILQEAERRKAAGGSSRDLRPDGDGEASRVKRGWTPTNARFASGMPLSDLVRIFIFTNGDGQTVLDSPVSTGMLQDTAGAPLEEFLTKVPFDVIGRSDIAGQIERTQQFPATAWTAITTIDPVVGPKAQAGSFRSCVRVFDDPGTRERGALVLIYRM